MAELVPDDEREEVLWILGRLVDPRQQRPRDVDGRRGAWTQIGRGGRAAVLNERVTGQDHDSRLATRQRSNRASYASPTGQGLLNDGVARAGACGGLEARAVATRGYFGDIGAPKGHRRPDPCSQHHGAAEQERANGRGTLHPPVEGTERAHGAATDLIYCDWLRHCRSVTELPSAPV